MNTIQIRDSRKQFNSNVRPVSTNSRIMDSFAEALAVDSFRYRDESGEVMLISPEKVLGVRDTYHLKAKPAVQRGREVFNQTRGAEGSIRNERSRRQTLDESDHTAEHKKIERINSQGKQFHHMMDLESYDPWFQDFRPRGQRQ